MFCFFFWLCCLPLLGQNTLDSRDRCCFSCPKGQGCRSSRSQKHQSTWQVAGPERGQTLAKPKRARNLREITLSKAVTGSKNADGQKQSSKKIIWINTTSTGHQNILAEYIPKLDPKKAFQKRVRFPSCGSISSPFAGFPFSPWFSSRQFFVASSAWFSWFFGIGLRGIKSQDQHRYHENQDLKRWRHLKSHEIP